MMLPDQEAALRSPEGQRRYAQAVVDGLRKYLEEYARRESRPSMDRAPACGPDPLRRRLLAANPSRRRRTRPRGGGALPDRPHEDRPDGFSPARVSRLLALALIAAAAPLRLHAQAPERARRARAVPRLARGHRRLDADCSSLEKRLIDHGQVRPQQHPHPSQARLRVAPPRRSRRAGALRRRRLRIPVGDRPAADLALRLVRHGPRGVRRRRLAGVLRDRPQDDARQGRAHPLGDGLRQVGRGGSRASSAAWWSSSNTALRQRVNIKLGRGPRRAAAGGADARAAHDPQVLLARGRVEREVGDGDSALVAFRGYLDRGSSRSLGQLEIARTLFLLGRFDGVQPYYEGAAIR